jgi:hypothetical protein
MRTTDEPEIRCGRCNQSASYCENDPDVCFHFAPRVVHDVTYTVSHSNHGTANTRYSFAVWHDAVERYAAEKKAGRTGLQITRTSIEQIDCTDDADAQVEIR